MAHGRSAAAFALLLLACGPDGAELAAPEAPSAAFVEVERVEAGLLLDVVEIPGQLTAEMTVVIRPEIEGVIQSIEFAEGERVERGRVLFELRSDEQKARVREAEAELTLAQAVHRRTGDLARRDVSSASQLERAVAERAVAQARLEAARVQLERTSIRAPFDGVLGELLVAPGDRVAEDTALTRIDAIDRLQLVFNLPELAVGSVKTGIPVSLRVSPFPGESFPGEVYFVSPTVDPDARQLLVKAWVPNSDRRLRPGLFAEVMAEVSRQPDALLVSETALVQALDGTFVWRLDGDDRVGRVPVEVGLRSAGRVEVRSGLRAGDRIVSAGIHKLSDGVRVRAAAPADDSRKASEGVPDARGES